jgi:hypothetical protein
MRAAQEHRRRPHVVLRAAGILAGPWSDRGMREVAHDADTVAERLERLEDFGKGKRGALRRRRPFVHRRPVRDVDASHAGLRNRGGLCEGRPGRNHRFEQRQRERDAGPTEERPP